MEHTFLAHQQPDLASAAVIAAPLSKAIGLGAIIGYLKCRHRHRPGGDSGLVTNVEEPFRTLPNLAWC